MRAFVCGVMGALLTLGAIALGQGDIWRGACGFYLALALALWLFAKNHG